MIGALGPAAGQFIGARKAADALRQNPAEISQQYADLKANMPEFGVGSAFNEYLNMSKQDPAADMERQIAAQQEASNVGALKSGGAKALLGGLGGVSRQAAQDRMGIEGRSFQRQQNALQQFGAQQQRAMDANTLMQQQLNESEFSALRNAEQFNRELDSQKAAAFGNAVGAVLGQFGKGHLEGMFKGLGKGFDAGSAVQQMGINIDPNQAAETVMGGFGDMLNQGTQVTGLPQTNSYNMNPFGSGQPLFQGNQKSGGMITKGSFSHEKNPIDIVQDGAKVGEMTGGEAILNPEQQKKVAKQSPYFRKLMREFAMRNRK